MKLFLTLVCFGCSFRTIFKLGHKKFYIKLAMLYRVRDLIYMLLIYIVNSNE